MERLGMYGVVALGGALGSVARAWMGAAIGHLTGAAFPWGTLAINILGSFVIGWFGAITDTDGHWDLHANWRAFVMVGLCGGFTTFSAFSLQTLDLLRAGATSRAAAYILASVTLCLVGVWMGMRVGGT